MRKPPLFNKPTITPFIILGLVGIGTAYLLNQAVHLANIGQLEKTLSSLGYVSAPIGLISWYIRENKQRLDALEKAQEEFELEVQEELAKLRIKIEFSFRFGQQQADLQQIKQILGLTGFNPPDPGDRQP
jgi:hypothetical protein